jgi:hypothetical protein
MVIILANSGPILVLKPKSLTKFEVEPEGENP